MKSDAYRLKRISKIGHQLLAVINEQGITAESVNSDIKQQWMVSTPLYNIGDHVNCLSGEFIVRHPEQPWSSIAGLRHRLVHDYDGTNWSLIGSILQCDIRPFIDAIDEIIRVEYDNAG